MKPLKNKTKMMPNVYIFYCQSSFRLFSVYVIMATLAFIPAGKLWNRKRSMERVVTNGFVFVVGNFAQ